jgi:hypothetical protein
MTVQILEDEIPFLGHVSFLTLEKIVKTSNVSVEVSEETFKALEIWFGNLIDLEERVPLKERGIFGYIGDSVLEKKETLPYGVVLTSKYDTRKVPILFSISDPQLKWYEIITNGKKLGTLGLDNFIKILEEKEDLEEIYLSEDIFRQSLIGLSYTKLLVKYGSKIITLPIQNMFFLRASGEDYWGSLEEYFL